MADDDVGAAATEKTTSGRMRPRQFGKYTLLDKIGTGGMAEIFKAVARGAGDFQKVLVVKRILLRYSRDPSFVKMFKDEALITAPLQHANIVSIYEFDQVDGQYYLAMELVNGVDLQAVMARANKIGTTVAVRAALFIVGEVCKALWYAYNARDAYGKELKIIHRDVSPSNILVSFDGEVKVTDFGVAKATTSKGETTQNGVLKGKLGYMSPETVLGRDVDNRSDLFSLGIILFELLTLKRMFLGKTDLQTLINIRDADVEKRLSRHPEIDPGIADIIRKALAKRPEDRYSSAQEFLDGIQDYLFANRMRVSQTDVSALMKDLFSEKVDRELLPLGIDDTTGVGTRSDDLDSVRDADSDSAPREPESSEPVQVSTTGSSISVPDEVSRGPAPREPSEGSYQEVPAAVREDSGSGDLPIDDKPAGETVRESTRNTKVKPEIATFRIKDSSGKVFGPISFENLLGLLKSRAVTEDELVSVDDADWCRLGDLSMVQNYLSEVRPSLDRSRLIFEGNIDQRFLVRMLTRICRKQTLTGLLVLKKGVHQKEVYFSAGRPKLIFSNLKEELFGEYLVRRDVVAPQNLARAVDGMAGGRLGDALVANGAVRSHQMAVLLTEQFRDRFLQIFEWNEGWCGFFDDVRIPNGVVQQDAEPMELVSLGVRTKIPSGILNAWMSEHNQHRFLFCTDSRVALDDLKLIPREMRVVNLIGTRDSIRAILDGLPQSQEWTATVNRVIYLLLETGVIRFRAGNR